MKFVALALTLLMGISLTSCLNSDDNNSSSQISGIFAVNSSLGTVFFTDGSGVKYYPTSTSLATVESSNGFKTSSKVAYLSFTYDSAAGESASTGYTIALTYAVSLDTTVETVENEGASNDSISTAPISSLGAMTSSSNLYVINNHLVLGVEYYMSKLHYFTLVYYPEETTSSSTELKLYLRHNSKGDTSTSNTSYEYAFNSNGGYPFLYFKAFDLSEILSDYLMKTGKSSVTINLETKESDISLDLSKATTKNYTLTYSFNN